MKRPILFVFVTFVVYIIFILIVDSFIHIQPENYSKKSIAIIEYWNTHSIVKSKFIPTLSEDNSYYVSHPPLAYYVYFLFSKVSGIDSYFTLNTILIAVSSFFVYLTICLLTLKQAKKEFSIYGFIGLILYLSSYPIIRYQLLNFHPDIFVLPFLIISQYLFLKLLMKERYRSVKYYFLIGVFLFIINYSSWFGVIFSAILILLALVNLRKGYKLVPYILLATFITVFSVILIYMQYAVVGGWKNIIFYFKDTYLRESPIYGNFKQTGIQITYHIIKNLGVLLCTLFILILYSFKVKKRKFLFTKNGYKYIVLGFLPVFLYSFIFLQYFQNTFTGLYFVAPLIVCICIWLEKLLRGQQYKGLLLKIILLIVLTNLSLFIEF